MNACWAERRGGGRKGSSVRKRRQISTNRLRRLLGHSGYEQCPILSNRCILRAERAKRSGFLLRLGINTEVSRYILGIGNTKQLTTNTIYRIGSLLYILARINILGWAPVVSMFGVNLIKCRHLKSCLTPIYCGRLNW